MARPSRWDDVVRSAARIFRERGFAGASLEEIAEDLGMWKGSLYNYISSKEDLLEAVIKIPAERLLAEVEAAKSAKGSPEDRLRAIIRVHVNVLVDVYDFAAVYLYEVGRGDVSAEWGDMDRRYTAMIEDVIAAGVEGGEFRKDLNVHLMTMSLVGALNWLVRWWSPAGSLGPDVVAQQIADTFLLGIRTTATRTRPRRVDVSALDLGG